MEITDVRVKLIQEPNDRLKAVCSITLDGVFVVRDLKVVEGTTSLFVAMPSRKLTSHCGRCGSKNHLRARFCNECGSKLPPPRLPAEGNGRTKLHRDIAHPITTEFREMIQARVIEAYQQELELASQPGYTPRDIDEAEETAEHHDHHEPQGGYEPPPAAEPEPQEEETSEYDALIAGLRGRPAPELPPRDGRRDGGREGGRDGGRRDGGRRDSGRSSQGGRYREGGSREGGRPAEGRREYSGSGRDEGRRSEGGRGESDRPRQGGSGESRPRPDRGGPPRGDAPFGSRGPERREAPLRPVSTPPPPPKPAPPPAPAQEEDADEAFGAGLL